MGEDGKKGSESVREREREREKRGEGRGRGEGGEGEGGERRERRGERVERVVERVERREKGEESEERERRERGRGRGRASPRREDRREKREERREKGERERAFPKKRRERESPSRQGVLAFFCGEGKWRGQVAILSNNRSCGSDLLEGALQKKKQKNSPCFRKLGEVCRTPCQRFGNPPGGRQRPATSPPNPSRLQTNAVWVWVHH